MSNRNNRVLRTPQNRNCLRSLGTTVRTVSAAENNTSGKRHMLFGLPVYKRRLYIIIVRSVTCTRCVEHGVMGLRRGGDAYALAVFAGGSNGRDRRCRVVAVAPHSPARNLVTRLDVSSALSSVVTTGVRG